jgi:hypothetical protein
MLTTGIAIVILPFRADIAEQHITQSGLLMQD